MLYNKLVINYWYNNKFQWLAWLLYPLEIIYIILILVRKILYKYNIFTIHKFKVPVIVVGNITVGGTGKTPMVIYLANHFKTIGLTPGIITRGYKSKHGPIITRVTKDSDPSIFGDEPVILANNTDCPVIIGKNRAKAAKFLLHNYNVDIIIADDGLQHYALNRDLEIIMIDGQRMFGNGYMLPRGPLRERANKLQQADLILLNGGSSNVFAKLPIINNQLHNINLIPQAICNIVDLSKIKQYTDFIVVHAVAAIGNNDRFFSLLESLGIKTIKHAFPDHYQYQARDFYFNDNLPIIMTEKDAIKCQKFAKDNFWYLKVTVDFADKDQFNIYLNNFLHRLN